MIINVPEILSPIKHTNMLLVYIYFLFSFKRETISGEPRLSTFLEPEKASEEFTLPVATINFDVSPNSHSHKLFVPL